MRNKLILFLMFLVAVQFSLTSRDKYHVDKSTYILPNENSAVPGPRVYNNNLPAMILAPGFLSGDVSIGPEILTKLDGWYDYMTNGDCRHYIQVDKNNPLNITCIYTTSDSTEPAGATTRRTRMAFSTDGGTTWESVGIVPQDIRTGFGDLVLKPTGEAVFSFHAAIPSLLNSQLSIDVAPMAATFTTYSSQPPARVWPEPSIMTNGNIVLVANLNTTTAPDSLVRATFNGTTVGPWTSVIAYTNEVSNQRWTSAAGGSGNGIIISDPISVTLDTLGTNFVRAWTTTDNGASYNSIGNIFRPFVQGDTISAFFGIDVSYKPGTTNWYYVMNATGATYHNTRLYLIRSSNLTPVLIADSNNIPWMLTGMYKTFAGVTGIDHPSLGWSEDGNVLYCAYSVCTQDTGANGWTTRDIAYQFSTNDGATWSAPTRITNTPTIDEGYASVSFWNKGTSAGTYELNLTYMKDPGDGPTAFNAGQALAPASHNRQIYRKITQATTIGIHGNNNQVPMVYSLSQNFPNPFNPSTVIEYGIPKNSFVSIKVYDLIGREVATLVNAEETAGYKSITFDAKNLASGIYYYSIKAGEYNATKKMVLIK